MQQIAENKCFNGRQLRFRHASSALNCEMHFSVYLPPAAANASVPVLYWLSGLTCTDENFVTKAGAQRYAAEHGVAIVAPDTSPRGEGVPDDPEGAWDFGLGAGFYVNATQAPWSRHYHMYDYVAEELPALVTAELPLDASRSSIFGHSMGGHGALTIGSPMQCPWGVKALGNYLGDDTRAWARHDSVSLIRQGGETVPMLVDQGEADDFLDEQLRTPLLQEAVDESAYPATIRMQPGYDHSYFFIATFIGEHIAFHSRHC